MRFKGRVKNWDSGRRIETNKESTACKESKIIRPANNVEILSENCMVGSRRLKKNEWSKEGKFEKKGPVQGQVLEGRKRQRGTLKRCLYYIYVKPVASWHDQCRTQQQLWQQPHAIVEMSQVRQYNCNDPHCKWSLLNPSSHSPLYSPGASRTWWNRWAERYNLVTTPNFVRELNSWVLSVMC